jgi:hypothetical protein
MKKITLLFALLISSIGFSQDLILGFETGESGAVNGGPFGGMAGPTVLAGTGSNTTQVLEIVGNSATEVWQGFNLTLSETVDLTNTQTMTIDVKSSTAISFLVKVNGGIAGAPEAAAAVSHNGDGNWQTLSFTFDTALDGKAAAATGQYTGFVIHTYWADGATGFGDVTKDERTFYVDNIQGPKASTPISDPEPTDAPATPPSRDANDVISLYGEAYTAGATISNVSWDDSDFEEVTIAGNKVLKIAGANFIGMDLDTYLDASGMTHLHMDYWIATDWIAGQVMNPKLSNHAAQDGETSAIDITNPINNQEEVKNWQSKDFDLTGDRESIKQLLITQAGKSGVYYLDNVYLYVEEDDSPAAPTTASPTPPSRDANDVISLYSEAYTAAATISNVPWDDSDFEEVTIAGNKVLKIAGANFIGMDLDTYLDASGMTHLHMDYWIATDWTAGQVMNPKLSNHAAQDGETSAIDITNPINNQEEIKNWQSKDFELSGDRESIKQLLITQAGKSGLYYLDNVYLYVEEDDSPAAPTTASPTPPSRDANDVISLYSEAYTAAATISNVPWDDSDFEEVTIAGNKVLKIAGANFIGMDLDTYLDASGMTHLHMDYWIATDWTAGQVMNPKLSNHAAQDGETSAIDITNPINNQEEIKNWQSKDFELSGDRESIKQLLITQAGKSGLYYLDNVYLYREATAGVEDNNTLNVSLYPNPTSSSLHLSAPNRIKNVAIYNLLGKEVISLKINKNSESIDVSNLASGIYIIKYSIDNAFSTAKFIKE